MKNNLSNAAAKIDSAKGDEYLQDLSKGELIALVKLWRERLRFYRMRRRRADDDEHAAYWKHVADVERAENKRLRDAFAALEFDCIEKVMET